MLTCDDCRDLHADDAFGLLDAAETAALRLHEAGCPACALLRGESLRQRSLIALAAKLPFPAVTFRVPAPIPVHLAAPTPAVLVSERPRGTVHGMMMRWAVAASVFLAVAGLGGGALRDLVATAMYQPKIQRESAKIEQGEADKTALEREIELARDEVQKQLKIAASKQDELFAEWAAAEDVLTKAVAERPFRLDVDGPGSLVVGAPNEFRIRATGSDGNLKPVSVSISVVSAQGDVLFQQKRVADRNHLVRLPASVWTSTKQASGPAELRIDAAEESGAATARVQQTVTLELPALATHLAIDRPLVRPGELIYFRSLTLDRATLRPVTRDLMLKFHLEGPDGRTVTGSESVVAAQIADGSGRLLLGPDGLPIRGVACGAIAVPQQLLGGEYTLRCTEVSSDPRVLRTVPVPLASVRILVNTYVPDRFVKSLEFDGRTYGPGDVVQVLLNVKAGNRPLLAAKVTPTMSGTIDGRIVPIALDPVSESTTDADGKARFRFTLPKDELASATFSIAVAKQGVTETIVRPVPLRSRAVRVEFFPEGGDLIAGVPTQVYFRATGTNGKPADLRGTITDGAKTVASAVTLTDADLPGVNQGLGRFAITPEAGKTYYLTSPGVDLPDAIPGSKTTGRKLPAAKEAGVALQLPQGVVKPDESLPVRLTSVGEARKLVVGVYLRGQVLATREVEAAAGKPIEATMDLGSSRIAGVLRVTVFEVVPGQDWKPVAERLAFRRGGRQLDIAIAKPAPASSPGSTVTLDVTTKDETGATKPAVLYAAVVNQSVIAMADDKTARRLPAHFLIAGEVRNPDELERADFFLDPAPKAAESLDLLLGTQGWRRFAEQAPDQFRKSVASADAEQLLASLGIRGHTPMPWRIDTLKLFDEFRPKFETAAAEVEKLESRLYDGEYAQPFQQRMSQVIGNMNGSMSLMRTDAQEFWFFQDTIEQREDFAVPIVVVLIFVAVGLIVFRFKVAKDWPERRSFVKAAIVLIALAAIVTGTVIVTSLQSNTWQNVVRKPEGIDRFGIFNSIAVNFGTPMPITTQDRPSVEWFAIEARAASVLGARSIKPTGLTPLKDRAVKPRIDSRNNPNAAVAKNTWIIQENHGLRILDQTEGNRVKAFPTHLVETLERLSANSDQTNPAAWRTIWDKTPRMPPSIVREYAFRQEVGVANAVNGPPVGFGGMGMATATPPSIEQNADTLLWKPIFLSNDQGRAELSFGLPIATGSYEVLVAGHTLDGRLGATTMTITVQQPLAIDLKMPPEIGSTDTVLAPLTLTNSGEDVIQAELGFDVRNVTLDRNEADSGATPGISVGNGTEMTLIDGNSTSRQTLTLKPTKNDGTAAVLAKYKTLDGLNAFVRRNATIVPAGYPVQGTATGTLQTRTNLTLTLPTGLLPETLKAGLAVYPNAAAELQSGLSGMLKEPVGCFEQASATNYPNVLILEYLRERGELKPETTLNARDFLERGYARLVAFECPVGTTGTRAGFEWFGAADRAHTALTAYALLQFTEMNRVSKVDPELLARTRRFLLDRRLGHGGWRHGDEARSFGSAPVPTLDAYVTWAISESDRAAGTKSDLDKELEALKSAAGGYRLALAAGALQNAGAKDEPAKLIAKLKASQKPEGRIPAGGPTITGSLGDPADVETTALAGLVFLRAKETEAAAAALKWLLAQRKPQGGFGSTQATILTLKLLVEQARLTKPTEAKGMLIVIVGGRTLTRMFDATMTGPMTIDLPPEHLKPGDNDITVSLAAGDELPVVVTWTARAEKPDDKPGLVRLTTKLDALTYPEGAVAKLSATLVNTGDSCGMTTAVLGIPAGLKLPTDFKQLKTLTDSPPAGGEPTISWYEVRGRELILYRRGMAAKETLKFAVDLIADVPGDYTGPASRAYLYYDDVAKDWQNPLKVTITELLPAVPGAIAEPKE